MPLYESPPLYTYEQMKQDAKILECECGGKLDVAWDAEHNCHILRCGNKKEHSKFIRLNKSVDRGNIPGWKYSKQEKRIMAKELGTEGASIALRHQGVAVMTRDDALELVRAYWPTAPDLEVTRAALMCQRYNLDPGRKQIHLMPFQRKTKEGKSVLDSQGKPVIDWSIAFGIGATRTMAIRQKSYGYIKNSPRPATDEEQKELRGKIDKTHIWFITWLKDLTNKDADPIFGFGNWPLNAQGQPYSVKGAEKGNTPENMAAIRSERAAFDKLNPNWLPAGTRVYDEQYAEAQVVEKKHAVKVDVEPKVNKETGEILESETSDEEIGDPDIEEGIFTEEKASESLPNEPPETKMEVGSDAWYVYAGVKLNISDAGWVDLFTKWYKIPEDKLNKTAMGDNFKLLEPGQRLHLTKLIQDKAKALGVTI